MSQPLSITSVHYFKTALSALAKLRKCTWFLREIHWSWSAVEWNSYCTFLVFSHITLKYLIYISYQCWVQLVFVELNFFCFVYLGSAFLWKGRCWTPCTATVDMIIIFGLPEKRHIVAFRSAQLRIPIGSFPYLLWFVIENVANTLYDGTFVAAEKTLLRL